MCGITGIFLFNDPDPESSGQAEMAIDALSKRGPDASGIFSLDNCILGHRRLAIIDTSTSANQPFTDPSGKFTIVFNGEIFNYKKLRDSLVSQGIRFSTESDTEVLLQAYILYKTEAPKYLDGEFAFAIYDHDQKKIFAARDRFGIKPFFYYSDQSRFVFSSELKSLLAYNIPKTIDLSSLRQYLHLNYVPSPWSIFENVRKLQSGHSLTVGPDRQVVEKSYYSIPHQTSSITFPRASMQLKSLLEESVANRMQSDVPVGTFLSGGIDSSVITLLAAKNTKNLPSFSIGFKDEPYFDETSYALLAAKHIGSDHTVFMVGNDELYANLHSVLDYIDEPFADSSALAMNLLCMHARKYVKVALSGDGADELFGGYNKHAAEWRARHPGLPEKIAIALAPIMGSSAGSRNSAGGNLRRQIRKFAEGMQLNSSERYWKWAGFAGSAELLIKKENESESRKKKIISGIGDDFNSILLTDVHLVLENDMLVKADRMSMSQSLEIRVPFLDQKIVDLAFSLPAGYKIGKHERKKVLHEAFRKDLPAEIFSRKKHGFEVPLQKWFRDDLGPLINELLSDELIRSQGLFDPDLVKQLRIAAFGAEPGDAVAMVWNLVVFQYWWKKYFNS